MSATERIPPPTCLKRTHPQIRVYNYPAPLLHSESLHQIPGSTSLQHQAPQDHRLVRPQTADHATSRLWSSPDIPVKFPRYFAQSRHLPITVQSSALAVRQIPL